MSRDAGPVKGGQTVIAFVDDPTGYKWELIQRPEPIPEPIAQVHKLSYRFGIQPRFGLSLKLLTVPCYFHLKVTQSGECVVIMRLRDKRYMFLAGDAARDRPGP